MDLTPNHPTQHNIILFIRRIGLGVGGILLIEMLIDTFFRGSVIKPKKKDDDDDDSKDKNYDQSLTE